MVEAMRLWEHAPDELTTIPVPDLALLVLADFREGGVWHKGIWINGARQFHHEHFVHANIGNHLWKRGPGWTLAHLSLAGSIKTRQMCGGSPRS